MSHRHDPHTSVGEPSSHTAQVSQPIAPRANRIHNPPTGARTPRTRSSIHTRDIPATTTRQRLNNALTGTHASAPQLEARAPTATRNRANHLRPVHQHQHQPALHPRLHSSLLSTQCVTLTQRHPTSPFFPCRAALGRRAQRALAHGLGKVHVRHWARAHAVLGNVREHRAC